MALVFGLLYTFLLPPLQAPDEALHLCRAYGLSEGHFVAPALTALPANLTALSTRYPPHLEKVRKVPRPELEAALREPLDSGNIVQITNEGMNVNTWIPYVPSAIALLIARLVNVSPLGLLYIGRLANLIGYVALTWLALCLLPAGRVILYVIALMPMALHQAASLSWDSIVFGIAYVFCALIVHYSIAGSRLEARDGILLVIAVVIVSLCKVDFALLPLVLLLPFGCFGSRKRQIAFWTVCGVAAAFTNAVWEYVDRVNLELFKRWVDVAQHTDFPGNIWYLYHHPGYFLNALGRLIVYDGFMHLTEFVGTFGWLYVRLPAWSVTVYVLVLLGAAAAGASALRFSWLQRAIVLGVVLLGCFGCLVAMWLTTPTAYIRDQIMHNIGALYGIQGRHFIPFAFPALLLLANQRFRTPAVVLGACVTACIVTVNVVAVLAIQAAY